MALDVLFCWSWGLKHEDIKFTVIENRKSDTEETETTE